jgi:sodium/potassium/calcium exchanger 6
MDDDTIRKTVDRWRRPRYSARPFALTILAITLISLLAWAKTPHHDHGPSTGGSILQARDITIKDEEVG